MSDAVDVGERYDEAFNEHDLDARRAALTENSELILPGGGRFTGPDQILQVTQGFWMAFPDGRIIREHHIGNEREAATEGRFVGTHTGPFPTPEGEVRASGNRVEFAYASIRRVENDRIIRERLYFDQMEFLQQLGALPGSPTS